MYKWEVPKLSWIYNFQIPRTTPTNVTFQAVFELFTPGWYFGICSVISLFYLCSVCYRTVVWLQIWSTRTGFQSGATGLTNCHQDLGRSQADWTVLRLSLTKELTTHWAELLRLEWKLVARSFQLDWVAAEQSVHCGSLSPSTGRGLLAPSPHWLYTVQHGLKLTRLLLMQPHTHLCNQTQHLSGWEKNLANRRQSNTARDESIKESIKGAYYMCWIWKSVFETGWLVVSRQSTLPVHTYTSIFDRLQSTWFDIHQTLLVHSMCTIKIFARLQWIALVWYPLDFACTVNVYTVQQRRGGRMSDF